MKTKITLYDYWRSSASYRLRIALNLAGISYDIHPVDLTKGEHKTPEYLAITPQGRVPVLDIDGQHLSQTLAIIEYLDTSRALNLIPRDPATRARVQALAQGIAVDIHPVCNSSVVAYAVGLTEGRDGVAEAWMARFIRPGLQAFEEVLAGFDPSPYCCGDMPGLADICLIPQLYNARRWGVQTDDLPRLSTVAKVCENHPAFVAAAPENCRPVD